MGLLSSSMKYLLFLFNFLVAQLAVLMIVFGSISYYYMDKASSLIEQGLFSVPIGIIVLGTVAFTIAFFGCCGAITTNRCMLMTFACIMFVILILEVAVGALIYFYQERATKFTVEQMRRSMREYHKGDEYNPSRTAWDYIQNNLNCCGIYSTADWTEMKLDIPESCPNILKHFAHGGCLPKVLQKWQHFSRYISGSVIALGVIEVVSICFACAVAGSSRD